MTNFNTRKITTNLPTTTSLKAGSTLQGRYLIVGVLGIGGMGAVYEARDLHFPNVTKMVALKEMINMAPDPQLRQIIVKTFEREANLLATLSHPAIPKIYDLFNQEDRSYLVMERINGKDLETVLNETKGFLPEETVIDWAIQLCDVLTYLHSHKPEPIVFRDMKPSNVMLDTQGIRLIDFGIAKGFQAGQKGTMIGTEGYSPPEQYRGEASPPGDIYALGATLHHLLTKKDPRLEAPFSFAERPLRKLNTAVSPEFELIINKSLSYNPSDRFLTTDSMKQALNTLKNKSAQPAVAATPTLPPPIQPITLPPVSTKEGGTTTMFTKASATADNAAKVTPLWVFKCEDEIRNQPLPVGKKIYVGVYDNNLYSLSRDDGKFIWKFAAGGGFAASPVSDGNNIYIGSEDSKFYAINAENGKPTWTYPSNGSIRCTARVAQGVIFVGSDDAHLHALSPQGGKVIWRFEAQGPIRSRPAILEKEGRAVFGCESGEVYCVDFSGQVKWRFKSKRPITSSPAVTESLVIVGGMDSNVYGLEANSGWAVWRQRTQKPIVSSPVLTDKAAIIGSADNHVYAFEIRSGRVLWRFETGDQVASNPVVSKSGVYFGSVDGYIYCLDVTNGKLRWKFQTDGPVISSPSVMDDVVYVGSADHNLYALPA
jgi:outer membrane protein assembly factor BamB/tRNA A-37 threonylcarbamoyl transferase component Bud32